MCYFSIFHCAELSVMAHSTVKMAHSTGKIDEGKVSAGSFSFAVGREEFLVSYIVLQSEVRLMLFHQLSAPHVYLAMQHLVPIRVSHFQAFQTQLIHC